MINKKEIELEVKKLLEKFSKELEKIKKSEVEVKENKREMLRKEGEGLSQKELKKLILKNSKNKNKDFIIAKEKSW